MARTNDGNLLQHFVECQIAWFLREVASDLHLVCTHAMAPFEPSESPGADEFNRTLIRVLESASTDSAIPLAVAYARTRAALDSYPNTAELVASLLGEDHLSGVLCEKDEIHASVLMNRWARGPLVVRRGNWRGALSAGQLAPPDDDRPWLFAMDPYTWLRGPEANKSSRGPRLCQADLELLRPVLGRYANRRAPGALTVPVYGVDEIHAAAFRRAVLQLADRLGLERTFLGVPAREGRRHLMAVLSPAEGLAARVAEAWEVFRIAGAAP